MSKAAEAKTDHVPSLQAGNQFFCGPDAVETAILACARQSIDERAALDICYRLSKVSGPVLDTLEQFVEIRNYAIKILQGASHAEENERATEDEAKVGGDGTEQTQETGRETEQAGADQGCEATGKGGEASGQDGAFASR
jgi:hypothetical protein